MRRLLASVRPPWLQQARWVGVGLVEEVAVGAGVNVEVGVGLAGRGVAEAVRRAVWLGRGLGAVPRQALAVAEHAWVAKLKIKSRRIHRVRCTGSGIAKFTQSGDG